VKARTKQPRRSKAIKPTPTVRGRDAKRMLAELERVAPPDVMAKRVEHARAELDRLTLPPGATTRAKPTHVTVNVTGAGNYNLDSVAGRIVEGATTYADAIDLNLRHRDLAESWCALERAIEKAHGESPSEDAPNLDEWDLRKMDSRKRMSKVRFLIDDFYMGLARQGLQGIVLFRQSIWLYLLAMACAGLLVVIAAVLA
jgi:hypothetical protein